MFFVNVTNVSAPAAGPLTVSFTTPTPGTQRGRPAPLAPATHLQLRWEFPGGADAFSGEIAPASIRTTASAPQEQEEEEEVWSGGRPADVTYHIDVARADMPRVKDANGGDADVTLYVWKGGKLLGQWPVGKVPGLVVPEN